MKGLLFLVNLWVTEATCPTRETFCPARFWSMSLLKTMCSESAMLRIDESTLMLESDTPSSSRSHSSLSRSVERTDGREIVVRGAETDSPNRSNMVDWLESRSLASLWASDIILSVDSRSAARSPKSSNAPTLMRHSSVLRLTPAISDSLHISSIDSNPSRRFLDSTTASTEAVPTFLTAPMPNRMAMPPSCWFSIVKSVCPFMTLGGSTRILSRWHSAIAEVMRSVWPTYELRRATMYSGV